LYGRGLRRIRRRRCRAAPQLELACQPPVSVYCESGRVGSLDTGKLKGFIFEADALYHARLGDKLRGDGFDVERDERTNSARMRAVPEDACLHFSKRTNMGEEYAKIQAARHGEVWDELRPRKSDPRHAPLDARTVPYATCPHDARLANRCNKVAHGINTRACKIVRKWMKMGRQEVEKTY
jgi:hypothetical protein